MDTKDFYFSQSTGSGQIARGHLPNGDMSFYFGKSGTALTTDNFVTGPSSATTPGTNGYVQGYCGWFGSAPAVPEGLSGSVTLGTSFFPSTSCAFNSNFLSVRATNLLTIMNNSSKYLTTPYITIDPSASAVGVYTMTFDIRFMYQWNSSSNVRLASVPENSGLLPQNWTSLDPTPVPETLAPQIRLKFPIKIHILPPGSKGSYIERTRSVDGVYGVAGYNNFSNVQTIDPSEDSYATWSFITNNYTSYFTFSGSTSGIKSSTISWVASTPPGSYDLKIKAQSQAYTVDKPELEFTIVIKYDQPNSVYFQEDSPVFNVKDNSGSVSQPNEIGNIVAIARTAALVSTYVKQDFAWNISDFKINGNTASMPDWLVQKWNNDGTYSTYFTAVVPSDSVGTYTFTLKATTKDPDYASKNVSTTVTINVVPNVSTMVVENIETTIVGKSHAAGTADADDQRFVAETGPYLYPSLQPNWSFNSIKKDGNTFDNSTNIFTISNGLVAWTSAILYGEYEITVKASYSNVFTTATCVVQIDRPEATWKTPAITYTGKKEFYASNKYDGTSNSNFTANFNEFEDALPPTWEIRNTSGQVIENDLLYIGPSGTLNWKAGLAPNNTPVDYSFYVTGTTTTNETPETKAWVDPDDQSTPPYTLIVLHVLVGNVDDVSLTDDSAAAIADITNVRSGQIATSSYSLQGRVTHADGTADTRNFVPSLIASGTTENVPDWLDVTTPDANGIFKISWNGAVKGTYTVKVYLFAENINDHDYGYQSVDIIITVTDYPPNSITVTTPNDPFAAQVDASGISTQTVSASCLSAEGSTDYINQSVIWTVSNIKNPANNTPAEMPTITVLPNNTISWTALPLVGNWTFSLNAKSAVNAVNKTVNNVTISVSPVAPDFFFLDSSSVLADGSNQKNLEFGQSFKSQSPTLTSQYNGHSDWSDNTLWEPTYSIVMEQNADQPTGLSIEADTGKFSVASTTAIGTYYFHIHVVMTLKSGGAQLYNPLDTYVFTLNVNPITPDACVFESQVTTTSLSGFQGWSGETDTSTSWTDDKFVAHMEANGSATNVLNDVTYSILMTNSSGTKTDEPTPAWLAIGPDGEIEWDQPSASGTFYFVVLAHSASLPAVSIESTNFYTLTISPGTTPAAVQINNEPAIDDILSNVVAAKSEAGQIDTPVSAEAFGESEDIYFQRGIIYSISGNNIPSWLHINSETGVISWDADWTVGSYDFTIRATSTADAGVFDECGTNLTIKESNAPSNGTGLSQLTMILIVGIPAAIILLGGSIWFLSRKHISGGLKKKR